MTDGLGIELRGVTVRYGRTAALNHLDLDVPLGVVHVLVGENGAGKTTLARAVSGLVLPTSGDLRIAGVPARSPAIHRVRRSMGFLPQNPVIYDDLTGTEFLRFIRDLYGVGRAGEARHLDRLARADVGAWVDTPIRTYSAGMRKKIGLLASLLPDPTFWILDEPFAGLDGMGAQMVEEEVGRRRESGGLVLITAHDLELVGPLADRVSVLQRGRMVFQGTVASAQALRLGQLGIESAPGARTPG